MGGVYKFKVDVTGEILSLSCGVRRIWGSEWLTDVTSAALAE